MQRSQKTVVIPGASRPVGRAIARRFAAESIHLVLPVYDWPESIEEMKEEFSKLKSGCLIIQCDLRKKDEVSRLASLTREHFGTVDYLINNIERGGMPVVHGSYEQPHNASQWELEFDTTIKAKWLLYQNFMDLMKNSADGAIVNISSIAAFVGRTGPAAPFFNDGYSIANRGIEIMTQTWAREMAPDVRVNELCLGFIQHRHGEGTRGWGALTETEKANLFSATPLQRTGTPEEVADAVYFLAAEATYFTGTVLQMDGGYLLGNQKVPPMPKGIL